jgi:hypothetical protein
LFTFTQLELYGYQVLYLVLYMIRYCTKLVGGFCDLLLSHELILGDKEYIDQDRFPSKSPDLDFEWLNILVNLES